MASNIQKILKIAAHNSFNNDTVNTLITHVNDIHICVYIYILHVAS